MPSSFSVLAASVKAVQVQPALLGLPLINRTFILTLPVFVHSNTLIRASINSIYVRILYPFGFDFKWIHMIILDNVIVLKDCPGYWQI
jgi:hypothetical protein